MRSPLDAVTEEQRVAILRVFIGEDNRIIQMPRKWVKKLVVLDWVAAHFDVGTSFTEPEVNAVLRGLFDDYVSIRRYLVDAGFMARADGRYWRVGGSVTS